MNKSIVARVLIILTLVTSSNVALAIGGTKQAPPVQKQTAVESIGDYWDQFWQYLGW